MNGAMDRAENTRVAAPRIRRVLAVVPLVLALSACNSWRTVGRYDGWTLYSESGEAVEASRQRGRVVVML